MNLEQQVTNLELSKKLKELRVKQESLFYWAECCDWKIIAADWHNAQTGEWGDDHRFEEKENYSAFTVAELGEILPQEIYYPPHEVTGQMKHSKEEKGWSCGYWQYENNFISEEADTEADARAKMLIYLLENKLIKI